MIRAPGHTLRAQALYLWVLVRRFKLTFFSLALLVFGGGTLMWRLYAHIGQPISWSRAAGVPVLIEDVRTARALEQANIKVARAIVCATDDDLANLNIALDARRMNPRIRVVMRLFDDDLVAKTKEAFQVEAFSTSALAAPALAAAALDSAIRNSFEVGGRLVVIAELQVDAMLENHTVAELRDSFGMLLVYLVRPDGSVQFNPTGSLRLQGGD